MQLTRLDCLGRTFAGRLCPRTPATSDVGALPYALIMTDEQWSVDDDVMLMLHQRDDSHPGHVALRFFLALTAVPRQVEALQSLVTPESLESWGDFSGAAAFLAAVHEPALGTTPKPAEGAPDVAYMKVLTGKPNVEIVTVPTHVLMVAFVTLVWRPELGQWRVHSIGDSVQPEDLPRTSPGVAPAY